MRFGEDSNMSVDSMLVHGCTGTHGIAPFKQTMIAVELDGKSHGDEPFLFGKERWVAMEAQRKRDVAKDAARDSNTQERCGQVLDAQFEAH